jgi:putative addiction module component (TIGR02574 family)
MAPKNETILNLPTKSLVRDDAFLFAFPSLIATHVISGPWRSGYVCGIIIPSNTCSTLKGREITESVNQLAKKALGLSPTERIRLVEAILYSLDKPDPDIEKSWVAESEARYKAYKRGELVAIDWDEVRKRFER